MGWVKKIRKKVKRVIKRNTPKPKRPPHILNTVPNSSAGGGSSSKPNPDNYPGDDSFTGILQEIYHGPSGGAGISGDKIVLSGHRNPARSDGSWTRTEIVTLLLNRYADVIASSPGSDSCQSWLFNTNFSVAAAVNSLTFPSAYDDPSGWRAWAGTHSGTWFSEDASGAANGSSGDDALWHMPRKEGLHPPGATRATGTAYDFQPVEFRDSTGKVDRHGWNQSHRDVEYLWGWDPKNEGRANGRIGAHLGFRHVENGAEAIFWFTAREAFFEAIKEVNGVRRRISVGNRYGKGLWTVS